MRDTNAARAPGVSSEHALPPSPLPKACAKSVTAVVTCSWSEPLSPPPPHPVSSASATSALVAAFTDLPLDPPPVALLDERQRSGRTEGADLRGRGLVLDVHRDHARVFQARLEALDLGALGAALERGGAILRAGGFDQLLARLRRELVAGLVEVRVRERGEVVAHGRLDLLLVALSSTAGDGQDDDGGQGSSHRRGGPAQRPPPETPEAPPAPPGGG